MGSTAGPFAASCWGSVALASGGTSGLISGLTSDLTYGCKSGILAVKALAISAMLTFMPCKVDKVIF